MGDISEMRGLIVVISFIAVFFLLASLIPQGFLQGQLPVSANKTITPNEGLDAYRMFGWNATKDITIIHNARNSTSVHGYNVEVEGFTNPYDLVQMYTYAQWWFIIWDVDYFRYYRTDGTDVTTDFTGQILFPTINNKILKISTLDADFADNYTMMYQLRNSHVSLNGLFTWNTTAYATPTLAFEVDELYISFETNFDDMGSSINAWTLLSSVLFFQYVPSIPTYVSLMISIPIWVCISYLLFIFILRMVGAIFGGGGA